jgi:hypothetical protein
VYKTNCRLWTVEASSTFERISMEPQPDRPVLGAGLRDQPLVTPQHPGVGVYLPKLPNVVRPVGQPVSRVDWFRRAPGGGTLFVKPTQDDESNPA